jgi:predicted membrane channel-forming protein YqfA (hemolysin III family)
MWQRLSGLDKFVFVGAVIAIWGSFVGILIFAMQEQWLAAAILTLWMLHPGAVLYRVLKRGSGKPQPRAVQPGTAG